MKYQLSIGMLLLTAVSMASAQVASHAPTAVAQSVTGNLSKPVVRVNGTVLTNRDLLREMYAIFPYARQHNGFPKKMEPEIRKGAMQMMEFEELVYQEALRRKMSVPAAQMNRAVRELQKQFPSEAEYQEYLQREFQGSSTLLRNNIRRSLLIENFLKSAVDNKSFVSVAAARAYYHQHPEKFRIPESFEFQSISVVPPDNPNAEQQKEARERAQDFLRQAKATKTYEEFGLLAEKISEDAYRVNMGDHKAVPRAELPTQIVQAALAMKVGQVSDLIQIDSAYTVFRLNRHIPAGKKSFAEIKDELQRNLRKQKTEQLRSQLDKALRKNAKVEEM